MFNILQKMNHQKMMRKNFEMQQIQNFMNMKAQMDFQERVNALSSKTNSEEFDKNGYLIIRNLYDPKELYCEVPAVRGRYHYYGKLDKFEVHPMEEQVPGSVSRYYYPTYKEAHSKIRIKIEEAIGKKLFNTYYYDRFYFPGQPLNRHMDRDACEISVTVNVSTNLKKCWPIWIKTPDTYNDESKSQILEVGKDASVCLNPGDGMIYKGCERPHWRHPMPSRYSNFESRIRRFKKLEDDSYYHQIFFHYVLADGNRAHYAGDVH